MASELGDLSSRDARTVCEALGRYEDTLRGAVREIHADIQVFKRGVGRQVEEVLRLASPLARTVSELQEENRRLRAQLERLARRVEALGRSAGLPAQGAAEAAGSPPAAAPGLEPGPGPAGSRFSSHAKLAVTGRSQSVDLDDRHKPEFRRVFSSSIIENGHQSSADQAKVSHELTSFHMSDSSPEVHAPAVALQMPHLPVTAVTRISEKLSGETVSSAATTNVSASLPAQSKSKNETVVKTSNQSVKAWNSSSLRTMGSSTAADKTSSVTKSVSATSYGMSSGTKTDESATDSYYDVIPKSHSPPPTVHRQVERRRELVRSQTLPRTSGTQARKALFEKFEQDSGKKMAHCDRLIEVDDMMVMGHKPDPMCIFTYVQSLYNHLRRFE
ncbi:smoothelin-like protein 2 isoform X2 [Rhea pennata]|uniref:smoothelin-like protein 2 isoform X2 n=1 Tax=Rhea pennata TaxID=8795 RepID=UPI002E26406E